MTDDAAAAEGAIAIVGLSGRFPGAGDVATFWRNLCTGTESITHFRPEELEDSFPPQVRADPNYVAARPVLEGIELFDAGFFGMAPREAALTDPQHRVFLECCWEALEDAGHDPSRFGGPIGVVAGCSINTYVMHHLLRDRGVIEEFTSNYQVGSYPMLIGAGQDFLATRVAYKLDLRGPAMTVQSACSTSLLAVAQACQSLLLYQADMMLAGGVSISVPQRRGYQYQDGGMVSPDGHCRAFDAKANGTVFGAGAGVVLLKRLEDAVADGNSIYAVIRGFGVNNDGSRKVGYTAPSVDGQAAAIVAAQAMAGVEPRSIRYVECHGTATPLGDPIEFSGLVKAFAAGSSTESGPAHQERQYCALGSVKTNVGHLDIAAGVTGLIKTALAIRHGQIPPTLHFTAPNPGIDLDASPFFVNTRLSPWPAGSPRRAGVSAFGVGGTNVHLVLDAGPPEASALPDHRRQIVILSARTDAALASARARMAAHLRDDPTQHLADIAHTLQAGRREFPHRCAVTAANATEAAEKLTQDGAALLRGQAGATAPRVAFLFPGQGSQYVGMGRGLYDGLSVFRDTIDRCASILQPLLGLDLRTILFPPGDAAGPLSSTDLTATSLAQPAIFAVEYALARTWLDWGIAPDVMVGHSVGEFVAACLADVFSLEDALALVAARGRLMQDLPGGAMLAVRLAEAALLPLLTPPLGLAAVNGPSLCVVAGPEDAIAELERRLAQNGTGYRRLHTSHAFHSPMMDAAIAPLEDRVRQVRLSAPSRRYVSTVTGTWITAAEATSPGYWARHCREPVRFADALTTIASDGASALLEVGAGAALATFARQGEATRRLGVITGSLPGPTRETDDIDCMLMSLGRLWIAGAAPNWAALPVAGPRRRVGLPTYPFERVRHWVDAPKTLAAGGVPPAEASSLPADQFSPQTRSLDQTIMPRDDMSLAPPPRISRLQQTITALLEELSGETLTDADPQASFLELGFDSLFLGQFVQQIQARLGVSVTFRQLLGELPSITALAEHTDSVMPPEPEPLAPAAVAPAAQTPAVRPVPPPAAAAGIIGSNALVEGVMRDQLQAMQQLIQQQLTVLQGLVPGGVTAPAAPVAAPPASPTSVAPPPTADEPSRIQVYRAGSSSSKSDLTQEQQAHIEALIARTVTRTGKSKRMTQDYRSVLADPRAAAGFRAEWKEMVYPIVCARAHGAHIWDIDGNDYIDLVNGYGQTAFGHAPDFVVDAVADQLRQGFAIGPQTPLAGEVATLFSQLTGNERVTFCNTGSEAVMAALRVARTVTGRSRVVMFGGAYHGQFDEVLVKGARNAARALPAAPGIPPEAVANMVVLPYATPESLEWVRAHAEELAAVVVEPVQSRHPGLQPKAFIQDLRRITEASGTALVMDEVVTGFRMHPGGMQALFDVRADMATYGKVVGGGLPIGILAGRSRFMDALDGGMWMYGDESYPETAPTFFAGTFVRHPLVMAATLAVLRHLQNEGPALQEQLTARTARLVATLNTDFKRRDLSGQAETYGSLFYFSFANEDRLASLLYYHLRARGIYIQEGFPCFLTTSHSAADLDRIAAAFAESLDELQSVGILGSAKTPATAPPSACETERAEINPTEQQTEIWLSAQLGDEASCAFNESITLRLEGELDEAALETAVNTVVARHDALRATFTPTGEAVRFAPAMPLHYPVTDLSDHPEALATLIEQDARTPFDLVSGPLFRAHLVRLAARTHAFVLTGHHIVCDGWSINVILEELAAVYTATRQGKPADLPVPLAFSTYAMRSRDTGEHAKVAAFWQAQFPTPDQPLELPTDRPRLTTRTFNGATVSRRIEAAPYQAIRKAGARSGCTLFVMLLAGFQTLMGRLADRNDVTVGVPTAGQSLVEGKTLVGHCVNFLPIRSNWTPTTSVDTLLKATKRRVLDAYEHQDYTLGTLVRDLNLPRSTNRLPLTEIQFNLERLSDRPAFEGMDVTVTPNAKAFVNFDLFLNVIESASGLRLDCDYNTDLFDEATINRWLSYYEILLATFAADSSQPVVHAGYLPDAERAGMRGPATGQTADQVHRLFEIQAAARPHDIAARFDTEAITYAELDQRANRLAHLVRRQAGGSDRLVGVCLPRSLDLLVALLATLKAGCAYVPLDPSHPPARLRHVLDDAAIAALVIATEDGSTPRGEESVSLVSDGTPIIDLTKAATAIAAQPATCPEWAGAAESLAYVIYTSGSTGRPKGVEVTHPAVVNLLSSMAREPGLQAGDVLLAVTTVAFDIAALELFLPLSVGATVVIADRDEVADGFRLLRRLDSVGATAMQATPATWRLLLEAGFHSGPALRMLCGGEALTADLAERLLKGGGELWNMYGPTETTIWSSCARITDPSRPITIGHPIANTQFYVLDSHDQPVAPGVVGQLHIGGDGVARGYVNRPELTAEKFVANPSGPGRIYRTGDLARVLPDGTLRLLGRVDHQIKLRGYRIELGEIESVLLQQDGITAAAVMLREDTPGEARLVGYYVQDSRVIVTPGALRSALAVVLPDYMIPTSWVRMDALPLTANAKLDRAALPPPALPRIDHPAAAGGVAAASPMPATAGEPVTETETVLAAIWADVLQRDKVGTHDDLFDLGADSIHLFRITARANRQGLKLAARQLLRHRTIAALALHLEQTAADAPDLGADKPAGSSSLGRFRNTAPEAVMEKLTGRGA